MQMVMKTTAVAATLPVAQGTGHHQETFDDIRARTLREELEEAENPGTPEIAGWGTDFAEFLYQFFSSS